MNETTNNILANGGDPTWITQLWTSLTGTWQVISPYVGLAILAALVVVLARAAYAALSTPKHTSGESRWRVFTDHLKHPVRQPAAEVGIGS